MKKIVLLLVGVISLGIGSAHHVQAESGSGTVSETTESLSIEQEDDGEASAEMPNEGKHHFQLNRATNTRKVTFKKFFVGVTDGNAKSVAVPISNSKYTIVYEYNNRNELFHEGQTNEKGEILDLPMKEIPLEVTRLKIRFYMGNDDRGYVQKFTKNPYRFTFHCGLNEATTNHVINYSNNATRFGATGDEDTFFYNFQAARMNHYFDKAVQEYSNAVHLANQLVPGTASFELAPININFEKGKAVNASNGFHRNGYEGRGTPEITMSDRTSRNYTQTYLMHNVMHEWTHWNLYRYAKAPGGSYVNHYSYNANPKISFKEGWPLLIGDLYALNYDMKHEDLHVQQDNVNGINRLFGKSTNYTVKQVLYDLIDTNANDENFHLSQSVSRKNLSDKEVRQLNLGILHSAMVESKSVTLQDLVTYLEKNYVLNRIDKEKFAKLLEVNGLSKQGAFTLTNEGNALTAPLQAVGANSDFDED